MKKILLTLMIVLLAGLAAQAATKYQINVGDVEVTSDNCNNVTGGDIESGTVKYNPTTKVLTLTNVTIKRTSGSGNFALHNRACSGLRVLFVGDNYLYSKDGPAIKVNSGVGLSLEFDGGENTFASDNNDAIFVQSNNNYELQFRGKGRVHVNSGKTYGMRSDAGCIATFGGIITNPLTVDVYGPKGAINWNNQVGFYSDNNCVLMLRKTGNSSYPVITASKITQIGSNASIVEPPGAVVSSDGKTISYNGSPVYNQDIVIAGDYIGFVATINARNFPDANFRNRLLSLYPKGYITEIDINNCTYLNVNGAGISNLTGIEYFTALESLECYNNSLSTVKLSNKRLKYLNCGNNNLTSITGIPSTLETLFCHNNPLTSFSLTGRSSLQTLHFGNCTKLTSLHCYNNNLTTLDVSGCTALTDLRCWENANLETINGLEDCTAITNINCEDCKIRDLSAVNGMLNIKTLYANNNRLTSLTLTYKDNLVYLHVSGNTLLTYLYVCSNYALKALDASNCTALTEMYCLDNSLTSLNVSGNTAMTELDCSYNEYLTTISGLADCTALKILCCNVSGVTDLGNVRRFTKLESLGCSHTKITKLECDDMEHLKKVCCSDNPQLTTLNVTNCDQLVTLDCYRCPALTKLIIDSDGLNGKLTSLNLTGTTALEYLSCSGHTGLSTITNLANCTALKELYCFDCAFTSLSAISGMTKLEMLYCPGNKLTTLNLTNNTKLTELDFSDNSGLTTVTGLANCTALTFLGCENCALANLNGISSLSKLEELNCHNNQLTSLNLQGCSSLETLRCFNNRLTSLTVNGLAALKIIMCHNNQLSSLNVSGCSALTSIQCYKNRISGSGMTTLVNSLPTRTSSSKGNLYAIYNSDEGNTMTPAQVTTAKNKYWTPKSYNGSSWVEYTGQILGDMNGDGNIDVADVTALIAAVLNGNYVNPSIGDINGDGNIDVADATMLISRILNGN